MEAITFDFWNTLYKTSKDALHSVRINGLVQVLQSAGYKTSGREVFSAFKKIWYQVYPRQRAYGEEVPPPQQLDLIFKELDANLNEAQWKKAYYYYAETLLEYPPQLNTDVKETLPLLRGRFKLAVICNTGLSPGSVLRRVMQRDGIIEYFDHLTFSDEVGYAKPYSGIFEQTLKKIATENFRAAHIGDDMITDIIGAKKAGMTAVWLAPDSDWKVPEADYHLQSVKGLLNLW